MKTAKTSAQLTKEKTSVTETLSHAETKTTIKKILKNCKQIDEMKLLATQTIKTVSRRKQEILHRVITAEEIDGFSGKIY